MRSNRTITTVRRRTFGGTIVLALMLALACGDSHQQPFPDQYTKRDQCGDVKLIKDMGLTGSYLKGFITCSARQDPKTGGSMMPNVLQLVNELDAAGLQTLIDFLLQEGDPQHPGAYPYLNLFAVLLDRGNTDDPEGPGYASLTDRYDHMQLLLKQLDPQRAAALVLKWQQTPLDPRKPEVSYLDYFLDEVLNFADGFANGTIGALTYNLLDRSALRQQLLTTSMTILGKDSLYRSLEAVMQLELSEKWPDSNRRACIQNFATASPSGYDGKDYEKCQNQAHSLPRNGLDRWRNVTARVGQEPLKAAVGTLLDRYLAAKPESRQQHTRTLLKAMQGFWRHNAAPLASLSYLVNTLTQTKIKDLGFLLGKDGILGQLITDDPYGPVIALRALGEKIGFTALEEALNRWLITGDEAGSALYCGDFQHGGLQAAFAETSDAGAFFDQLAQLLGPNQLCPDNLPPLVAKVLTLNRCDPGSSACWPHLKAKAWPPQIMENTEPTSAQIKTLVATAFAWARAANAKDPYLLNHKGLTYGRISDEQLATLEGQLAAHMASEPPSAASLAGFAAGLATDPRFQDHLQDDFLENLLQEVIGAALRRQYLFSDLFSTAVPDAERQQSRLSQVLWGAYENGPTPARLQPAFTPEQWPELAPLTSQGYAYAAYDLLRPYRFGEQLFRSPVLVGQTKSFRYFASQIPLDDYSLVRSGRNTARVIASPAGSASPLTINTKNMPLMTATRLVDLDQHPLRADLIATDFRIPSFTSNFLTPMGSEGWQRQLLRVPCSERESCPLDPEGMANLLAAPLSWQPEVTDQLLDREQPLTATDYRRLLFYISRHLGIPAQPFGQPHQATGKLTTRSTKGDFYAYLSYLESFGGQPWLNLLRRPPTGLINGSPLDQLGRSDFAEIPVSWPQISESQLAASLTTSPDLPLPQSVVDLGHLGLLSFVGGSAFSLVPMTGFNVPGYDQRLCWQNNAYARCPATMQDDQGDWLSAAGFSDFVNQMYASQLCPYLKPTSNAAQDLALASWLQDKTGWHDLDVCDQPQVQRLMAATTAAYDTTTSRMVPSDHLMWLLADLAHLGRAPALQAGLKDFTSHMRFYKAKLAAKPQLADVLKRAPFFGPEGAAWVQLLGLDSGVGIDYRPSLVDAYLTTVVSIRGDGTWDRTSWPRLLQRTINVGEDYFAATPIIQYLKDRWRYANSDPRRGEQNLLTFALEELAYLNSDDPQARQQRELLVNLLSKPFNHRSMALFGALNIAFEAGALAYFPDGLPEDWRHDPALRLLKFASQPVMLQDQSALLDGFTAADLTDAMTLASAVLEHLGPTPSKQARSLEILLTFLDASVFANDRTGQFRFGYWQEHLKTMISNAPTASDLEALDQLVSFVSQPTIPSFGTEMVAGPLATSAGRDHLVSYLLFAAPEALSHYQASTQDISEDQHLRQLLLGQLRPLTLDRNHAAFASLKGFLSQPIWGLARGAFIGEPWLRQQRPALTAVLDKLALSSADTWLKASRESENLLTDSYRFMHFAQQKIVFAEQKEAYDFNRGLQSLLRLTKPSGEGLMLRRQLDLLETWFSKIDHTNDLSIFLGQQAEEASLEHF